MTRLSDAALKLSPHAKSAYIDGLAANDALFQQYGITTPLRETNLLAQMMGETGGFTIVQESGSYSAARIVQIFGVGHHSAAVTSAEAHRLADDGPALFERVYGLGNPRKAHELGNTQKGDGWKFRGIGPLQSTGRGAAHRWGIKCSADFETDVLTMVAPQFIMLPPLFEWSDGNLNIAADRDDVRAIRRAINGGYNGIEDVEAWHAKIWPLLSGSDKPSFHNAVPDPATAHLQDSLNVLGYLPKLATDGKYGPQTKIAVRWFQRLAGLKVDGVAGPVTNASIALRLDARPVSQPDPIAA